MPQGWTTDGDFKVAKSASGSNPGRPEWWRKESLFHLHSRKRRLSLKSLRLCDPANKEFLLIIRERTAGSTLEAENLKDCIHEYPCMSDETKAKQA